MKRMAFLFTAICCIAVACDQRGAEKLTSKEVPHDSVTVINGVERSELALLMRKMYDEMKLVKDSLQQGYEVKTNFLNEFKRIQSAHATEPEKIDETYQAMADAFLANYEMFESSKERQAEAFNIMLQNCLVCHQSKCPGPVKAINKLKIKPASLPEG